MFDIYQLEHLVAIAEYGTLSLAAEHLHISQPTLSRSIQKLEEELGFPLFNRLKNKMTLNESGEMAVECARNVLKEADIMVQRLNTLERSRHTINIASCAPAPLWMLTPIVSRTFPNMTMSSEIRDIEELKKGLMDDTYQIVILPEPLEDNNFYSHKYCEEQLYVSLPPAHPLCGHKGIYMSELDGESMLLFSEIGFWSKLHQEKMPHTHFLIQHEAETLDALVRASAFPSFTSNLVMKSVGKIPNRVILPLLDEEATATFYICIKQSSNKKFNLLFSRTKF